MRTGSHSDSGGGAGLAHWNFVAYRPLLIGLYPLQLGNERLQLSDQVRAITTSFDNRRIDVIFNESTINKF
jgi:hypothetical protein